MEADVVIVKTTPEQSLARVLRDWILVIAIALGAAMLVRVFVLQQFYISGPSMEATLFQDNRVLVNKLSYRLHPIHRGDVVVFDRVTTSGSIVTHDDLIKRVIGVATDSVEIKQCKVFVNGTEFSEPYLDKNQVALTNMVSRCRVVDMPKVVVPRGQLFVMGDKLRNYSSELSCRSRICDCVAIFAHPRIVNTY
jgi:signal peptidase I